ncbi:menaquinol-cytochrome c reductase cytochrome b/c subunit [Pasteuria penetrans]|uniref:menaquinol-cytochrome c reductase cytochrome b/c subunit n=1 Tax=Pasteuria penetrans TaxID=86005 RepID=UPI000FB901E7|nr:menaquinol-cytochrome c reductase cytochrome b/c subunit [Pasteuria penetrans]
MGGGSQRSDHSSPSLSPEPVHYVGDSRVRVRKRKSFAPSYADFPGKTEAFFPDFLLREWMTAVVFLVAFLLLVMYKPVEVGEVADPTSSRGYIPFPDWYFLFLYQLLKYPWAAGIYKPIASVVLPGITFGSLLLVPWLDRRPERRPFQRPGTSLIMLLAVGLSASLTWAALVEHKRSDVPPPVPDSFQVQNPDHPGYKVFKRGTCIGCHGSDLKGIAGPNLASVGRRLSKREIMYTICNGRNLSRENPGVGMPANQHPGCGYLKGGRRKRELLERGLGDPNQFAQGVKELGLSERESGLLLDLLWLVDFLSKQK